MRLTCCDPLFWLKALFGRLKEKSNDLFNFPQIKLLNYGFIWSQKQNSK